MMSRAEELRAELQLIELEEAFVAAKADGTDTAEMRHKLRAHRRRVRGDRRTPGQDVAVEPSTIEATAETKLTGSD
jgi:hypothetical protein